MMCPPSSGPVLASFPGLLHWFSGPVLASSPGLLHRFFGLVQIIHGNGRGDDLGECIKWVSWGGHRGWGPQTRLNTVEWLQHLKSWLVVKHSNLADWTMNWSRTSRIDYGPHPHYVHLASTSHPPDITHMMNCPRPSLFSPLFHFCVILLLSTQTEEQSMG